MKYHGLARKAAFKIILFSLILIGVILVMGIFATFVGTVIVAMIPLFIGLWILFAIFTLYFFRDPHPNVPVGAGLVLAPGHGKVDHIDTTTEATYMGGEVQRVSIFLSVFNVHVQNSPVGGKVELVRYTMGKFVNAMKAESATHNENVLLGFKASDPAGQKVAVRLIAGLIARRIVPFVKEGDDVSRGDRISLIQFGSRADVYLPANAKVKVKLGDKVVGGQTVIAAFE